MTSLITMKHKLLLSVSNKMQVLVDFNRILNLKYQGGRSFRQLNKLSRVAFFHYFDELGRFAALSIMWGSTFENRII